MTKKRTSKSAAHRAAKRRKQLPPILPPAPKPTTPAPAPMPMPAPKPTTPAAPAPSPAPAAKPATTPSPAPMPARVAPVARPNYMGLVLGIGLVLLVAAAAVLFAIALPAAPAKPTATTTARPTSTLLAATATKAPTATKVPPTATLIATEAPTAAPLPEAAVPGDFVTNGNAIVVTDQNRWPSKDPTNGSTGNFVVKACQKQIGVYEDATFASYADATKGCQTGVLWFEPASIAAVPTQAAPAATAMPTAAAPVTSYEVVPGITLGQCAGQPTREARLDCSTALYFANGEKLSGIKAYFYALGITWTDLKVGNPFQPDATPLTNGSPRIWGALVLGQNVHVSGNSCLVTDVPSRITLYKWAFLDTRYAPRPTVGHYGEAYGVDQLVELAIHGDCSDWPEIRNAAQAAGFSLK